MNEQEIKFRFIKDLVKFSKKLSNDNVDDTARKREVAKSLHIKLDNILEKQKKWKSQALK